MVIRVQMNQKNRTVIQETLVLPIVIHVQIGLNGALSFVKIIPVAPHVVPAIKPELDHVELVVMTRLKTNHVIRVQLGRNGVPSRVLVYAELERKHERDHVVIAVQMKQKNRIVIQEMRVHPIVTTVPIGLNGAL